MIPSIELSKAIYSTLTTKYEVHETVTNDVPMPYITVGAEEIYDADLKLENVTRHIMTLNTWSKNTSSIESRTMNDFVVNSLKDNLDVNGFYVDSVNLIMNSLLKENEVSQTIYHGVIQVEIYLTEKGDI